MQHLRAGIFGNGRNQIEIDADGGLAGAGEIDKLDQAAFFLGEVDGLLGGALAFLYGNL